MPLLPFPQFVGGDYTAQSVNVAASELVNFYVEQTQSQGDQTPFPTRLSPTPGLKVFVRLPQGPIRAMFAQDGRVFVVGGANLYEIFGDGRAVWHGAMPVDDQPATICSSGHYGHQVFITSAGSGYIFDLNTNAMQQISQLPSNIVMGVYIDGFFFAMQATTSKVFRCHQEVNDPDGMQWDASDYIQVISSSDELLAIHAQTRALWNFGSHHTEVWTNQGDVFDPFKPIQPLVECGIAAPWSIAECFGSMCFIVRTAIGHAAVVQTKGYGIEPISTHNESRILTALPDLANVRAFSYQDQGHLFYVICPNTGPALVYDLVTGLWHRRGVWDAGTDAYRPLKQVCHAHAFGKHLVGDRAAGIIYEQSLDFGTDDGAPIRRVRTCPHVNEQQQWMFGSQVTIGVETGLAPATVTPEGVSFPQELKLSFSKDGGHTFSEPRSGSLGTQGAYGKLVTWYQTPGRFGDLVLRAETSSAHPVRLNSCQLRVDLGTGQR